MKIKFLALGLLLLGSLQAFAAPPPQSRVDQYLQLALRAPESDLNSSGRYQCEDAITGKYTTADNNQERAHLKYVLKCIRAQCATIGDTVAGGVKDILGLDSSEFYELLVSAVMSSEDIEKILNSRSSLSPKSVAPVTCENATPMARMYVVDGCLTRPVTCY